MVAFMKIGASFENDVQTPLRHPHIPQNNRVLGAVFILDNVLLPLLRNEISMKMNKRESKLMSSLHLNHAKKFASRVCKFVDCHDRGTQFVAPTSLEMFGIEGKAPEGEGDANSEHLDMNQLARLVNQWNDVLVQTLNREGGEKPRNDLPIGEVDFWRRRHVFLSDIVEQLNQPSVKFVLSMMETSLEYSLLFSSIQKNIVTTQKLALEAADNSKFLSTLERHLRTIQEGSLPSMITALPSLVDGISMVWSISRYYYREDKLFPLMKKIASQIASRVTCFINIAEFAEDTSLSVLKDRVSLSITLLESWKTAYAQARDSIGKSGKKLSKWQFAAESMFRQTDHTTNVCNDIIFIIDSLNNFKLFHSPDMLDVIDEDEHSSQIIYLVNSLRRKIFVCDYDIFDVTNEEKWHQTIVALPGEISHMTGQAEMAIVGAFQKVRSSEVAYELLLKLNGMQDCRHFVQTLIEDRHHDILHMYEKELHQARRYYEKYIISPPLCWRYTKSPGYIAAVNDVHRRVKKSMLLFKHHGLITSCSYGRSIKDQYIEFSKEVDSFKSKNYDDWTLVASDVCRDVLHSPVLVKIKKERSTAQSLIKMNFPDRLRVMISEGKRFCSLGYIIPERISYFIILQPLFESYITGLEQIAYAYNSLKFSSVERDILKGQIDRMDRILFPGFSYINWSSQSIPAYINEAKTAIGAFRIALTETRKHSSSMEKSMLSLAKMSLAGRNHGSTFSEKVIETVEGYHIDIEQIYSKICTLVANIDTICHSSPECNDIFLSTLSPFGMCHKYWGTILHDSLFEMFVRSMIEIFHHVILRRRKLRSIIAEENRCISDRTILKHAINRIYCTTACLVKLGRVDKFNDSSYFLSDSALFILASTIIEQYNRFEDNYGGEE